MLKKLMDWITRPGVKINMIDYYTQYASHVRQEFYKNIQNSIRWNQCASGTYVVKQILTHPQSHQRK